MNLEREFAAWADRRDPEALTRVFDGTAGRLLLLAAHLAGSGGTAEDLVQATFVAAMTGARSWDRRLPLWPWLAGILQNEARMHWRRQQRRREEGLEAAAAASAEGYDPARLAASEEAFAAVLRAIDALPLPYRQVLRLRLVHGLQQVEIARALEIPVGTVRAQVHRGLAQLRDALPAGVAVLVGAWLAGEGALMAQVRARVLEQATALAATATSAAPMTLLLTGGWWTVNGKTVAVVAGGAVLLLCLCFAFGVPPGASSEPSSEQQRPIVADAFGAKSPPAAVPAPDQTRRTTEVVAPEPQWPLLVTVRTRAGQAIAGADVQVWVAARGGGGEYHIQGEYMREDVAAGVTGVDGTFRCDLDEYRRRSILFRCTSLVYVVATDLARGREQSLLALPRTDEPHAFTAEVLLGKTTGIAGRVVDASGAPVAHASLFHQPAEGEDRSELLHAHSRADASFCCSVSAEDVAGRIVAASPGFGVGSAAIPEALPDAAKTTLDVGTIVLDGSGAIRGQVVLGDGSGVAGLTVFVAAIDEETAKDLKAVSQSFMNQGRRGPLSRSRGRVVQTWIHATTSVDGSFNCAGLDTGVPYGVMVRDIFFRHFTAVARPGGEPVRIVVADRQLLLVDVRDESGAPLPGAHVEAMAFDPGRKWKSSADSDRPGFPEGACAGIARFYPVDPQGRRIVLSPFGWVWRLGCFDEIAQGDFVRHEAFTGVHRAEQTLVLRAVTQFGSLRLVVVDEQGEASQKYGFYLRCLDRDIARNHSRLNPPADCTYRELPAGRWRLTVDVGRDLPYPPDWPKARGSQEQDIVIRDGRTTEVKIVTRPLGRVGFRLRADVALHELKELRIRAERDGAEVKCDTYLPENLAVYRPSAKTSVMLAKPGLPAGSHWFVITAKGYQAARCEAVVTADQVVELDVELIRQ